MAQEATEKALDVPDDDQNPSSASSSYTDRSPIELSSSGADPSFSRSGSFSRLNASAPEFVPRVPGAAATGGHGGGNSRIVKIAHHPQAPTSVIHVFHTPMAASTQFVPPVPPIGVYEYYGGAVGAAGSGFVDHEFLQTAPDPDPSATSWDGLSDDAVQKITKQVEYYFSDINLATTEHLMRFISKDPEGFVPLSVIASFKKIKALVQKHMLLANALRTSAKLVVSEDGKKVRRLHQFTEEDVEELQSRIAVAENLPEDHCYQNLMKIFSAVGNVKNIRTCYPQTPNGTTNPTNRSSKLDMLFSNKLHAFVEYETAEDAEKAVSELNNEKNWRSGLRLRLLNKCMAKHGTSRGRKAGHEGDGMGDEEDASPSYQPNEKQQEDSSQLVEPYFELAGEENVCEREGSGGRRGRGRGRARGRGRGQLLSNNSHHRGGGGHGHAIGTPPSSHPVHNELAAASRQPPGPRMPDGTRGFTMGRGKPLALVEG